MWIYVLIFIFSAFIFLLLLAEFSRYLEKKDVSFKVYCSNLWHKFLIFLKLKKNRAFPFDIKKYISKNAPIKIQIKLFQSSKQFQQIILKHRGKQCGEFYPKKFRFTIFEDETNITLKIDLSNKFLSQKYPLAVKEKFSNLSMDDITNQDLEELYPKLDLTELKGLEFVSLNLNFTVFQKYLVSSLVEIYLSDVFFENIDLPLYVMEQCPVATKIYVYWHKNLTSMSKLAAVKRKRKLKEFELHEISEPIHIQDIIKFINVQMENERFFVLESLKPNNNFNPDYSYLSWEDVMKIVKENVSNFSDIHIFCNILK